MIDFNQCDTKKCTGRKLERFGLVKALKDKERRKKFKGVVLSAFGEQKVSLADAQIC
jgi:pre-rRNA-processing protein TSR3